MSSVLDKLNLRPQERRLVVAATAILFVMLQFWLVWPRFKDWGDTRVALEKARRTLGTYRTELGRTNEYTQKLAQLQGQSAGVLTEEDAAPNTLIRQIQDQVRQSNLNASGIRPMPKGPASRTNEFFEEQTLDLGVSPTGAEELISFLVAIGSSDLMIRVKELTLSPDGPRHKLTGNMKLVASFQRKSSATGASAPAPKPTALSTRRP
jgi:hypothetical protein